MARKATLVRVQGQEHVSEHRNRLSAERYRRGWSQQEVADYIGTTPLNVSRWERGLTTPSPYFRHKLCTIFHLSISELGLVSISQPLTPQEEQEEGEPCYDPSIPLPRTNTPLVGRTQELAHLKRRLDTMKAATPIALSGLPGVGKTTLALELVYDPEIRKQFDGGILWAALGANVTLLEQLRHWGALLGITKEQMIEESTEAWLVLLRTAIGQRHFLLVLDDAWRLEDVLACKVGGPNCVYILTTRFPQIALAFAADAALIVREFTIEQGIDYLRELAPEAVRCEVAQMRELVREVGGLPLALTLIGNYLRSQAHNGQPRRIRAAIARMHNVDERFRLAELSRNIDFSLRVSDVFVSLTTTLAKSYSLLNEEARTALRALSTFPPKPEMFSEEEAFRVCHVSVETLDLLSDIALLESPMPGYYTLHPIIAEYARLHKEGEIASEHSFATSYA